MKSVQKLWAELSAKTELTEHKVELAKIDDINNIAKDIVRLNKNMLTQSQEMQNKFKELSGAVRVSEQLVKDFNRMKGEVESAAKELGVDISGIIKTSEQYSQDTEQTIKDMKKRWGVK